MDKIIVHNVNEDSWGKYQTYFDSSPIIVTKNSYFIMVITN